MTWALKYKAQLTKAFFATVKEMLGSSSQPVSTAEHDNAVNSSRKLGGDMGGSRKFRKRGPRPPTPRPLNENFTFQDM